MPVPADYSRFLESGETLVERDPPSHDSGESAYGYQTLEIQGGGDDGSNAVLLDVEPGGAVEPVAIIAHIRLAVRTLQGEGYAVTNDMEHFGSPDELILLSPDAEPVYLAGGEAYYYLNSGNTNLVLRDDSTPPFQGHEEVSITRKPRSQEDRDGRGTYINREFMVAFGALKNLSHDQLVTHQEVIVGATYRGNHGISYKVENPLQSATHFESTGKTVPGIRYTQLNQGSYPAGTEWFREEEDFLRGTEVVDGREAPIFSLARMPLTMRNLKIIVPGL